MNSGFGNVSDQVGNLENNAENRNREIIAKIEVCAF